MPAELARRHGWTDETTAGLAYLTLGSALAWQGRPAEAESWMHRAERTISPHSAPVSAMGVQYARGQLELARGRPADALSAFRAAERLAGRLPAPHPLARPLRAWIVHALVRLGEIGQAEQVVADADDGDRVRGEMRVATAMLRVAENDPHAATVVLGPVLDGSARTGWRSWLVEAFLLEAIARDALGDPAAAARALERALDRAEPDGALLWFLLHPAPELLERHTRQRTRPPRPAGRGPRPARRKPARAAPSRAAAAAGAAVRQRDPRAALPPDPPVGQGDRRRVPVLAVWGRGDEIFGPAGAQAFADDAHDAEIHLLDGGHFLLETAADEVAALIRDFLARRFAAGTDS
jgi:tetratricopeptide (TPR) repeat protein